MLVLALLAAIAGTFIYASMADPSPIMQVVCGLIVLGSTIGIASKFRHDPNTQVQKVAPLAAIVIGLVLVMAMELIVAPTAIGTIVVGFGLPLLALAALAIYLVTKIKTTDSNYVGLYARHTPVPVRVDRHR